MLSSLVVSVVSVVSVVRALQHNKKHQQGKWIKCAVNNEFSRCVSRALPMM